MSRYGLLPSPAEEVPGIPFWYAGINLARLPASQAGAPGDGKTAPVRHDAVKRVNHLRKVA